ncbi:MAG: hypothetical protein OFPI_22140 [Osedax symbiont Rs2]|nr:MAG: hypothetical protein OFPI_22140 [Osedax symbiont Rs2]
MLGLPESENSNEDTADEEVPEKSNKKASKPIDFILFPK